MNGVFNKSTNRVSDYFTSRKPKAKKNINAQVDRAKWELVKEYARYRGCPSKSVEDALVSFAIDTAYAEASAAADTPEFYEWRRRTSNPTERIPTLTAPVEAKKS